MAEGLETKAKGRRKFYLLQPGPRPRELTGGSNLFAQHGLESPLLTSSPPASIAESGYLRNVMGDIDIRRGDGMELGQLIERLNTPSAVGAGPITPLDPELLRSAFTLREESDAAAPPLVLPEGDRGIPTISGPLQTKDSDRKHKKHKDRDRERGKHKDRDKEREKEKDRKEKERDRDKDREGDKERDRHKDKSEQATENGDEKHRKHKKKKRKRDGEEEKEGEDRKHKKKKDRRSSKPDSNGIEPSSTAHPLTSAPL